MYLIIDPSHCDLSGRLIRYFFLELYKKKYRFYNFIYQSNITA